MGNQSSNKNEGLFDKKDKGGYEELKEGIEKGTKCSWETRIFGFIICFAIGWILSIFSSLILIIKHNTTLFAIMYSIGQVLNITGSCFLATPAGQLKDMKKQTRWVLTLFYVGSLIATLLLAFLLPQDLRVLILVALIIQIISYFLYTLSYVPFGRKIIKKFCKCLVSEE